MSEPQDVSFDVLALSHHTPPQQRTQTLTLNPCGLMLYHSASFYVIHREHEQEDLSPLLYWIPNPPTHHADALDVDGLAVQLQALQDPASMEKS